MIFFVNAKASIVRACDECAYLIWPHRDYLFWPHSASGIGGVRVN